MGTSQLEPQYAVKIANEITARYEIAHKKRYDPIPDSDDEWRMFSYDFVWGVAFRAAKEVTSAMLKATTGED